MAERSRSEIELLWQANTALSENVSGDFASLKVTTLERRLGEMQEEHIQEIRRLEFLLNQAVAALSLRIEGRM